MTPEQVEAYAEATGMTPDQVIAWFNYFAAGGP